MIHAAAFFLLCFPSLTEVVCVSSAVVFCAKSDPVWTFVLCSFVFP